MEAASLGIDGLVLRGLGGRTSLHAQTFCVFLFGTLGRRLPLGWPQLLCEALSRYDFICILLIDDACHFSYALISPGT